MESFPNGRWKRGTVGRRRQAEGRPVAGQGSLESRSRTCPQWSWLRGWARSLAVHRKTAGACRPITSAPQQRRSPPTHPTRGRPRTRPSMGLVSSFRPGWIPRSRQCGSGGSGGWVRFCDPLRTVPMRCGLYELMGLRASSELQRARPWFSLQEQGRRIHSARIAPFIGAALATLDGILRGVGKGDGSLRIGLRRRPLHGLCWPPAISDSKCSHRC